MRKGVPRNMGTILISWFTVADLKVSKTEPALNSLLTFKVNAYTSMSFLPFQKERQLLISCLLLWPAKPIENVHS